MLNVTKFVVVSMLLTAVLANAEARVATRATVARNLATHVVRADHPLTAMMAATLPPEEKPKTHWPWWLRIIAVVGVLVFIRLVAGSVRNNPGGPGEG